MVRKGSPVQVRLRALRRSRQATTLPRRGLQAQRRAARLRLRHPRLLQPRVRHPGAARAAHQPLHRAAQRRHLQADGRPRLARPHHPRGVRRLGRHHARRLPLHGGDLARHGPHRRLLHHPDRRRRHQTVRHRRAEAEGPRRRRQGVGRVHRHDRARVRLRRRLPHNRGSAVEWRMGPQWPEGLHLQRPHLGPRPHRLPHHQGREQARGPLDDLRPGGHRRHGDDAHRHHGRPRDQHRLLQRLRGPLRTAPRRAGSGLDAAHGRPQHRAPHPRRHHARHRPARLRRRPRLRQGAQAVRPARSAPSRPSSTASRTSPPTSRPPAS